MSGHGLSWGHEQPCLRVRLEAGQPTLFKPDRNPCVDVNRGLSPPHSAACAGSALPLPCAPEPCPIPAEAFCLSRPSGQNLPLTHSPRFPPCRKFPGCCFVFVFFFPAQNHFSKLVEGDTRRPVSEAQQDEIHAGLLESHPVPTSSLQTQATEAVTKPSWLLRARTG